MSNAEVSQDFRLDLSKRSITRSQPIQWQTLAQQGQSYTIGATALNQTMFLTQPNVMNPYTARFTFDISTALLANKAIVHFSDAPGMFLNQLTMNCKQNILITRTQFLAEVSRMCLRLYNAKNAHPLSLQSNGYLITHGAVGSSSGEVYAYGTYQATQPNSQQVDLDSAQLGTVATFSFDNCRSFFTSEATNVALPYRCQLLLRLAVPDTLFNLNKMIWLPACQLNAVWNTRAKISWTSDLLSNPAGGTPTAGLQNHTITNLKLIYDIESNKELVEQYKALAVSGRQQLLIDQGFVQQAVSAGSSRADTLQCTITDGLRLKRCMFSYLDTTNNTVNKQYTISSEQTVQPTSLRWYVDGNAVGLYDFTLLELWEQDKAKYDGTFITNFDEFKHWFVAILDFSSAERYTQWEHDRQSQVVCGLPLSGAQTMIQLKMSVGANPATTFTAVLYAVGQKLLDIGGDEAMFKV